MRPHLSRARIHVLRQLAQTWTLTRHWIARSSVWSRDRMSQLREALARASGLARRGQVNPRLLKSLQHAGENLDALDDRSLMQLRVATVAVLCRIREEVQVRSALDI